jgi:hypothetical protein
MIYGWDISTSIIGVSCFDDFGTFNWAHHLELKDYDGLLAKADAFKKLLTPMHVNCVSENYHFIEERLGGFSGGRTSAQVLMKLASFNAMCSYILWTHQDETNPGAHRQITYLHPSTWKSIMKREGLLIPKGCDKKAITLDFVRRKEPRFEVQLNRNGKPQPWNYDMADAYCLGRSGFHRLCTAKENSPLSDELSETQDT